MKRKKQTTYLNHWDQTMMLFSSYKSTLHLLLLLFLLLHSLGSVTPKRKNPCIFEEDCDSCLLRPRCAWCKDPNWKGSRCNLIANQKDCSYIENPEGSVEILEDRPLSGSSHQNYVQIHPEISQAKEYPVDLYYLMDLSNSMSDDREMLAKLADKIASAIQSITKDFHIGFGSFVDKEVYPFISLIPEENCQTPDCPGPYSFQHQMKLSPDPFLFREKVRRAPISGNIDQPEGGLDALVQVMVCDDQIGWRAKSRRVVIFTTDTNFHIAMDGKLGGIVTPNDGICHLNNSGFYTHSKILDYPSIGHIANLAKEHSVNIIWAVTEDQYHLYQTLTEHIIGSRIGTLSKDSSNIVELIREAYESITTSFKIHETSSDNIKTKFRNRCELGNGREECLGMELGTSVKFRMSVKPVGCVPETFDVSPVGLDDRLIVEVEPLCECSCAAAAAATYSPVMSCGSSDLCSGRGRLICGECSCCPGYFGLRCECEGTLDMKSMSCRPFNTSILVPPCTGRGDCVCGTCECKVSRPGVVFSGSYCEVVCDNTACETDNNGRLWDPNKCLHAPGEEICSGHGVCPCDKCICTTDGHYGEYCQYCDTCQSTCSTLRSCVECMAFFTESHERDCSPVCQSDIDAEKALYAVEYEEKFIEDILNSYENCTFTFKDCEYSFSYTEKKESIRAPPSKKDQPFQLHRSYFHVLFHFTDPKYREKTDTPKLKCPPEPNIWGLILGIIGAIVLIGIFTLLLWKTFTTISDRREYAKFEADRAQVKLPAHSNPIFKQATTTVQNPLFNPSKVS
ncbi:ITGB1 [Lepeophtheirus salmonis]|uniref:Integrin beta n=1 Tax=Lepeophtheirus salmonis TaxID=72036 RepID=A0A7R8D2N5_LEPSM|nr:ITGB1 [Lepeophtheirus salmonis]CAF2976027.1 ITGB1 [Lepeophtheirus salmonis]